MRAFGFVIAIAFGSSAHALDTLDSQELLALCQSEKQAEVAVCTGYINGFLDGAFATDPRVAENAPAASPSSTLAVGNAIEMVETLEAVK